MTRPPARPTLTLPAKTTPADGGETTSKGRKPVRSGFKPPKPTVAQRAKRHETIATRAAAQKAREAIETSRAQPKPAADAPAPQEAATQATDAGHPEPAANSKGAQQAEFHLPPPPP